MKEPKNYRELACRECREGAGLGFSFTMAFQPIVRLSRRQVFAHEALVRGQGGEGAGEVFKHVNADTRYQFDQACRVKAIELASRVGVPGYVSINFMPNAVYRPELCIRTTLEAARTYDFPVDRIIFEFTEVEQVHDHGHLREIVQHYRQRGFLTAFDDFGSGYSGLNLLADVASDLVKLDMALVRGLPADPRRRKIIRHVVALCADLGVELIAEGVETRDELQFLQDEGIDLFQGYFLARPAFEALPEIRWPD